MFNYVLKAGATSQSLVMRALDSTTGVPVTSLVFNSAGMDLQYRREGAAAVAITEVTLAALTTAYSSGGFLHIGAGYYRVDIPDAALASGVAGVLLFGSVTGAVFIGCYVQLVAYDPFDTVRLGLTALPNAAAEAAGGLYTRGSGAGQINQPANGRIDVNAISMSGTTLTARDIGASVLISSGTGAGQLSVTAGVVASNLAQILGTALTETAGQLAGGFKKWFDVASPVGTVNSIPNAAPGAAGGLFIAGTNAATTITTSLTTTFTGNLTGSVGSVTGAVGSVTGAVGSVGSGGITASSFAANAVNAAALATDAATEIADATWNSTRAGHSSAGTFGEGVASVQGNVTGSVASVTGAVGSVTGNVGGNVVGSVGSVSGAVGSVTGAVGSVTGNVSGNVTGSVGSLAAQAKADVNAEVVDALNVDTYTEPPQEAPGVTVSLATKINYLYKFMRNKITQTSTTLSVFGDDATTVHHKSTVTDDGTTYTRSEISSGP